MTRYRDGHRSMKALRDHFSGEGNATCCIERAEQLKTSLHYKNEGSLKFEVFLTRCQEMFGLYDDHEEAMTHDAQIRFLFFKINNSALEPSIAALKVDLMQKPKGSMTYTTVANHLASAVSALPENKAKGRAISGVKSDSSRIHDSEGKIKTGSYSDWQDLTPDEKRMVGQERSRLGLRGPRRGRGSGRGGGRGGQGGRGHGAPYSRQNSDLKSQNQKYRRQIKALKRKTGEADDDDDKSEEKPENDAGNHFGGKTSKRS